MTDIDRQTIVVEDEPDTVAIPEERGTGMGAILGIIAIIVLLAAVWYFALGPGTTSTGTTNNNTINNGGNAPAATEPAAAPSEQAPAPS